MDTLLWQPDPETMANSHMARFLRYINDNQHLNLESYDELYQWSLANKADFWGALWHYSEIKASHDCTAVLQDETHMPGTRWFTGARLNFAQNLLRYRDDRIAIRFHDERRNQQALTYKELHHQVASLARALRELGLGQGDRVAALMPNIPQTIIAMLATTSLGAIWSSCSPDFGSQGVLDRFGQIEPKILFSVDGYSYNGKHIDLSEKIAKIQTGLPGLQSTILYPYLDRNYKPELNAHNLDELIENHNTDALTFNQLPFDHPLYIMYSSGTTGKPKCLVHGAGGTLLQHIKELTLHCDLHRRDTIFYFTTCGWMMWNWLISSLATGATLVLYEGSPTWPDTARLFDLVDDDDITVFGTSARYLSSLEKLNLCPAQTHRLQSLRCILSTGSPLLPETFDYVYKNIKPNLQLASISGGTDIISCFALANPLLPVYRGQLQSRGLGMQVEVFDETGTSVTEEKGELVCTAPFPSIPLGFYNDPENKKFTATYFARFPGVWSHGDYAEITAENGLKIYGRSDATLNPGGVRIGTAEIYRQVEKIDDVLESLAVGQEWQGDTRIILFVHLREGKTLTDLLKDTIRSSIRTNASPRHVPAHIIAVADLPRTLNGKLVELAVKNIIHNQPVSNKEALLNPESLRYFVNLEELNC